jgi:hypothetical protein
MSQYERQFFEYFQNLDRRRISQPVLLGGITGSGGGVGQPPGGYTGQLPQTRVCYDMSELATDVTVASGESLLDNLNHIRYRVGELETDVAVLISGSGGGGVLSIYDDSALQGIATELDFTTGITATVVAGRATILSTGSPGIDKIVVISTYGGGPTKSYTANDAGLQDAFDNVANFDCIYIPPGIFTIDPVSITTKSISVIGAGKSNTTINISATSTDRWCFEFHYEGYFQNPTFKGFTLYCESDYEFGSGNGGFVHIESASSPSIIDVHIMGESWNSGTISNAITFYGLYFVGDRGYLPTAYDIPTLVKDVSINFEAGNSEEYFNIVGAYIETPIIENINITLEDIGWCHDVTGLVCGSYELINPHILIDRRDSDYNANVVGISTYHPGNIASAVDPTVRIESPYIVLLNYSDYADSGTSETFGIELYYGQTSTSYDKFAKVTNPYIYIELSGPDQRDASATSPYHIKTQYYNFNIINSMSIVKSDRSIGNPLGNIYYIYNTDNTSTQYVDISNSSFICIDQNDDPVEGLGSNFDPTYIRSYNTYFGGTNYNTVNILENNVDKGTVGELNFGSTFDISVVGNKATIDSVVGSGSGTGILTDLAWDVKGDIVVANGSNSAGILPIGTDGQYIVADSTLALGLGWKTGGRILISEQTPTGTGTLTWSSIPATFKSLEIEMTARGTDSAASTTINLYFNNDTTAGNYRRWYVGTDGASATYGTGDDAVIFSIPAAAATAGYANTFLAKIIDYSGTTFQKMLEGVNTRRTGATYQSKGLMSMNWENTAAINRIDIILTAGNYATGSTFRLYGLY